MISLIAGKGGTTADGTKLYNNSQVTVTRGNNASSYTFATQANGKLSNDSLFFSQEDENSKYPKATSSVTTSSSGTLTLLMPGGSAWDQKAADDTLLASYRAGGVTLGEMQRTARNVLKCAMEFVKDE